MYLLTRDVNININTKRASRNKKNKMLNMYIEIIIKLLFDNPDKETPWVNIWFTIEQCKC